MGQARATTKATKTTKKGSAIKDSIDSVSLSLKPKVDGHLAGVITSVVTWLSRRKRKIFILSTESERFQKLYKSPLPKAVEFVSDDVFYSKSDLLLSLGGDGTLIGAARKVHQGGPPIFGVNMGTLGFITEFSKLNFYDDLAKVLNGQYEVSSIPLYKVEVHKADKGQFSGHFINDLVISKNDISRMFSLIVETEEEHIYDLSGDGLIVSSPIGSTAYSMAAGGPIIHPDVKAMVATPICPHGLTHRPLVLPDDIIIKMKLKGKENPVTLTLDGQETWTLTKGQTVTVQKARRTFKMVKNSDKTYFHTLKEKFTHGRRD